jgi:hypothetical protein
MFFFIKANLSCVGSEVLYHWKHNWLHREANYLYISIKPKQILFILFIPVYSLLHGNTILMH